MRPLKHQSLTLGAVALTLFLSALWGGNPVAIKIGLLAGPAQVDLLLDAIGSCDAPIVVETPGDAIEHKADIAWLREHLG